MRDFDARVDSIPESDLLVRASVNGDESMRIPATTYAGSLGGAPRDNENLGSAYSTRRDSSIAGGNVPTRGLIRNDRIGMGERNDMDRRPTTTSSIYGDSQAQTSPSSSTTAAAANTNRREGGVFGNASDIYAAAKDFRPIGGLSDREV